MPAMDVVDYKVFGDDMQYVEVELDPGEAALAEAGAMMYMEDGVGMETIFGDGSSAQAGFLDARRAIECRGAAREAGDILTIVRRPQADAPAAATPALSRAASEGKSPLLASGEVAPGEHLLILRA